jgi:two-component system, OmpR family, sensor kinase
MLLRRRLALLVATSLVVALAASVILTDVLFGQIQHRQSSGMIERELARVQAVVSSGNLGADIVATGAGTFSLQFVTAAGSVALPEPGSQPIPLHDEPSVVRGADGPWLIAAVPWILPSGFEIGTIRLALDLREVEASRQTLRTSLVISGLMILLLALLGALAWLRQSLEPLLQLATEAERVDPADPRIATYRGPDDEVARVASALNMALEAIRERQRAERDALAEVAHEIAAPLTVVAGQLRGLESAHPHDARLVAARAAADELLYTSQDLLTLARGELDAPPDLSVVDVADVVEQIAAEYPGVRVVRDPCDARVLANPERMRQVTRNLVRNAVQAAGRGEGVMVRTRVDAAGVSVEVTDDGPGLTEAAQARVFERYVSDRRGAGAGAGVGLTVAKRVVEALDGSIGVQSRLGQGATFTITLPSLDARLVNGDGDGDGDDRSARAEAGQDRAYGLPYDPQV